MRERFLIFWVACFDMDKDQKIFRLKKQIERLKKSVKNQRYGLVWMDAPEAFEDDVENKLPVLKEVPKLAIKNNDEKPTHILIEGDNYHALTCLNYTHKGKIDMIYIDPPYNTGSDGFRYKDKRILSKFPDGTEVPKDHPFRHGYWLSFMKKRLELARDLLKEEGTIFISIDDNELSQLKLLCDKIFGQKKFITAIPRITSYQRSGQENYMNVSHDYVLCYSYATDFKNNIERELSEDATIKKDGIGTYILGDTKAILAALSQGYSKGGDYDFEYNGKIYKPITKEGERNRWLWTKERMKAAAELGILVETKNTLRMQIYLDKKFEERTNKMVEKDSKLIFHTADFMSNKKYTNVYGTNTLNNILGKNKFNNPKPVDLIKKLIDFSENKDPIVLDFFAGSGTTGHAVIEINNKDKKQIQFILSTNDENGICSDVCYPRINKVIRGYKNKKGKKIKGLGNSLKYYKTDFIGKNNILNATDEDRVELAHNAGELLAIAENTLELVKQNKYHQLFENNLKKKYTAVYFREELNHFDKFVKMVEKLDKETTVYVFSWGTDEFIDEFEGIKDIKVKTIPVPILEIYKNIYNLQN